MRQFVIRLLERLKRLDDRVEERLGRSGFLPSAERPTSEPALEVWAGMASDERQEVVHAVRRFEVPRDPLPALVAADIARSMIRSVRRTAFAAVAFGLFLVYAGSLAAVLVHDAFAFGVGGAAAATVGLMIGFVVRIHRLADLAERGTLRRMSTADEVDRARLVHQLARGLAVVTGVLAVAAIVWILVPVLQTLNVGPFHNPGAGILLDSPGLLLVGAVLWLASVLAVTWAARQLWSRGPVALAGPAVALVASVPTIVVSFAVIRLSFATGRIPLMIPPGVVVDPRWPGTMEAALVSVVLLAFFVGLPLAAAVDASRWSARAFETAGRGGRLLWIVAPIGVLIIGLGWAMAVAYFVVVRPGVAGSVGQ